MATSTRSQYLFSTLLPATALLVSGCFSDSVKSTGPSTGDSNSSAAMYAQASPNSDSIPDTQTRVKFKATKPLQCKDASVTSAVIQIVEISFLKNDGTQINILTGPQSVDLMSLDTQIVAVLGDSLIPVGTYDAIRITVGDNNYVISNGTQVPLKIPSGQQSGIKLQGPYTLRGGRITEVQLQFDADQSLHAAGPKYILKPTASIVSVASLTLAQEALLRNVLGAYSEQQIQQADYIVQATTSQVTSSTGTLAGGQPMIFTNVTLSNDDVLKGAPGATTQIELMGGSDGSIVVYVPHMPKFDSGDQSVLFLKNYPLGLGLIGKSGGKVIVSQ